jgi:GntR family transcriptional regulator/MocR family aminotransferase
MTSAPGAALWKQLFARTVDGHLSLQARIRGMLVDAILDGQLAAGTALPSSRVLAEQLGVARNTVVLAYEQLRDEGYLETRPRSGFFVHPQMVPRSPSTPEPRPAADPGRHPAWSERLCLHPSAQRSIVKPADWQRFPYPFLYGQLDASLFPTADWREASMKALNVLDIREWAPDQIARDDEDLRQQIRTRVLPRRGVWAAADELIVTVGAQHALYMVADLLVREGSRVALEDPGYPDARNIFAARTSQLLPLPVDGQGLPVDERLHGIDYLYTTPSHQCPTGVTMPLARREALLQRAEAQDFVIIEDDFESENRFDGQPEPALKSLDRHDRVIYVGSLSKVLAPGLRLGYIVAAPALITEMRALRRLMLRHPSAFIQRAFALYLSLGHYDAQLRRLAVAQRERHAAVQAGLARHLPDCHAEPVAGGGSCWLALPPGIDACELARQAAGHGVLIEPGDVFFHAERPPGGFVRLGYQSIPAEAIEPGLKVLGEVLDTMPRQR